MTIREALFNSVSFSVSHEQAEVIAITRGLDAEETFTAEVAKSKSFLLSKADMIKLVVTQPNISEGGVSISFSDKKTLIGIANAIYRSYDEPVIGESEPTVEFLDW